MPKKPKGETKSRQLKFHIEESVYEKCIKAKARGYFAGAYEGDFWGYLIWLGSNVYEEEVLKVELRAGKSKDVSAELSSRVAGE